MIRECVECHRAQDVGGVVASGGLYAPGISSRQPEWRCPDCRAQYPEPVEYLIDCPECDGSGFITLKRHCKGCDHECEEMQDCFICDGTGQFPTHDCNPGCDHSDIIGSLPEVRSSRGPIRFFEHPV